MPWIELPDPEDDARLAREYRAATKRAGRVYNIVKMHAHNPPALNASMRLYAAVTKRDDSPLTRTQRELIAVVVSRANECFY